MKPIQITLALLAASAMTLPTASIAQDGTSSAWLAFRQAERIASQRNRGQTCAEDAYIGSVTGYLARAIAILPDVAGVAIDSEPLRRALADQLAYYVMTGQAQPGAMFRSAFAKTTWQSFQGGALGPARTIEFRPNGFMSVRELKDYNEDTGKVEYTVLRGKYSLSSNDVNAVVTIQAGGKTEKFQIVPQPAAEGYGPSFNLRNIDSTDGDTVSDFGNEPWECEA